MDSMNKMGMIKLSVRDYMNSLHNYVEPPHTANWNVDKTTVSAPKSISEMLKLCEADPVELLIDLGFGTDEPDICTKIPSRFIMTPSEAKGITTKVFLDAQKRRMEIENPNLNGRFRQLEVLEQVTNAFSSLLNDVHSTEKSVDSNEKKSTLTREKRKRMRQLIWKFSRQGKLVGESPCMNTDESANKQDPEDVAKSTHVKFLRKKGSHPNKKNPEVSAFPARQESTVPSLVKQYNLLEMKGKMTALKGSKGLSEASQSKLQPPDSFEMEEVQSFEEDYPKALNQDGFLEMTRTSSCQSDSSGFLEELPEPLQNRHGSSDSIDSQVTLHGKSHSSDCQDASEDSSKGDVIASPLLTKRSSEASSDWRSSYKSLSVNTDKSDDVFQSFESHFDNSLMEVAKQMSIPEDSETEDFSDGLNYVQEEEPLDQTDPKHAHTQDSPQYEYPVYVTHYLRDISDNSTDITSTINGNQTADSFEEHVSDLQDHCFSHQGSFADDECSVELAGLARTSSPTSIASLGFGVQTPYGSVDDSDDDLYHSHYETRSTFQTEFRTNMYKSVTIQMPPSLLRDTSDSISKQHSIYNTNERNQGKWVFNSVNNRTDTFTQTEAGWWNGSFTNNHCSHQRSFLSESLSVDMGFWGQQHSLQPAMSVSCCHCCHHHHCCMSRCQPMFQQHLSGSPGSSNTTIERELSDTLALLRQSLSDMSVHAQRRDSDMENMRRSCQRYRNKLIEIEQHLQEQQADCFNILTSEEREDMRRLHLLRRNVLKEATELECHLDERARHVKESISLQLEEVLNEQTRLYSELEFGNLKQDCGQMELNGIFHDIQNTPSTSSSAVPKEDSETTHVFTEESKTVHKKERSQKTDINTIIQNIKKAFKNFNNS